MARKQDLINQWITSKKASEMLTEKSGHPVSQTYVRRLAAEGHIEVKPIDDRTRLYSLADVENYQVRKRGDGSIRREARAPRGTQKDTGKQERAESIA